MALCCLGFNSRDKDNKSARPVLRCLCKSNRERRSALESQHGDPFTLLAVFDEWIKVKAARQEPSRWEHSLHSATQGDGKTSRSNS